jgi:hypothetical protein
MSSCNIISKPNSGISKCGQWWHLCLGCVYFQLKISTLLNKMFWISLAVLVAGCGTGGPVAVPATIPVKTPVETPVCGKNTEVLSSTREFIRIEHPMNKQEQVNLISKKWCQSHNLFAQKTKHYCSGCCTTVFQCR